jgi:hypothetical protein
MLRDYRDWLESEVSRLEHAGERAPEIDARAALRGALERFDAEFRNLLYVPLERPLAQRVLTALELMGQQSTALQTELDALRNAIKTAHQQAILAPESEREPLEREFF